MVEWPQKYELDSWVTESQSIIDPKKIADNLLKDLIWVIVKLNTLLESIVIYRCFFHKEKQHGKDDTTKAF